MFSFGVEVAQAATKVLPPPTSNMMDEEAQKRNSDCIYFLASPLTCKKGSKCEYRHSEAARSNPRDCWYWKTGNCLNPRCPFRHLPFDGKPSSAASVASTSSASLVPQLVPATSSSNKSKTPCYFFSQGYCAKEDKCPFMHGASAACRADVAAPKNQAVGVNGKAVQDNGRPLIVFKQNVVTDGRPAAFNGSDTSSKVPVTLQEMPHISSGLGMLKSPESNGLSSPLRRFRETRKPSVEGDRLYDVKQSQHGQQREQGLQDTSGSRGKFVRAANLRQRCEVDAPREGSGRKQFAAQSDSHLIVKSRSNSSASNGQDLSEPSRSEDSIDRVEKDLEPQSGSFRGQHQVCLKHVANPGVSYHERAEKCKKQRMGSEEQDSSLADLRNHLMKRQKNNSLHTVSVKPDISRGQTDMVISGGESKWRSEDHALQQDRKAGVGEVKGAKLSGRESSVLLPRASLDQVFTADNCLTSDNRQRASSVGTSKKEALNFTGPKSLAQIKADKMKGRESASETVGKHNLSTKIAGKVAATRKLEMQAEATHSSHKLSSCSSLPIKKSMNDQQKTATSMEVEGPKPVSALLKRKRELDLDINVRENSKVRETLPGPSEAEASIRDSCRELEDGEVGEEREGCEEKSLLSMSCPSVYVKDDLQAIPSSSWEVLQRVGAEAAEVDVNISEEELTSDAEMEDVACGDADYGIDEDDDDEEDFAKKLGRFFALSSD